MTKIILITILTFFVVLFVIGLSADFFDTNKIIWGWLTLIIPFLAVLIVFVFKAQVKKVAKTCLRFVQKKYKILLLIIILLVVIVLLLHNYINNVKKDKINKVIISYCENVKWRTTNNEDDYNFFMKFLSDDEVACGDFLYLKPNVKKSNSGICHDEKSMYYYRTKIYKTFNSMDECLESGGRKPYN